VGGEEVGAEGAAGFFSDIVGIYWNEDCEVKVDGSNWRKSG